MSTSRGVWNQGVERTYAIKSLALRVVAPFGNENQRSSWDSPRTTVAGIPPYITYISHIYNEALVAARVLLLREKRYSNQVTIRAVKRND
jgi:hypothetical protein